jgi:hypothetical protein
MPTARYHNLYHIFPFPAEFVEDLKSGDSIGPYAMYMHALYIMHYTYIMHYILFEVTSLPLLLSK